MIHDIMGMGFLEENYLMCGTICKDKKLSDEFG